MVVNKKMAKNGALYIGISMVCMTLLKKKVGHCLAAGMHLAAYYALPNHPRHSHSTPYPLYPPVQGGGALVMVGKRLDP